MLTKKIKKFYILEIRDKFYHLKLYNFKIYLKC